MHYMTIISQHHVWRYSVLILFILSCVVSKLPDGGATCTFTLVRALRLPLPTSFPSPDSPL